MNKEQEKFNAQCREIVFEHARAQGKGVLLPQLYNPYDNANQTIVVFEIVLQYVPHGIKFLVIGRADADEPENINVFKRMRDFIRKYGVDEYMLPPAVAFNKMCAAIVGGYNIFGCNANDMFDPYNNIDDLARILPVIIEHTPDHPFKIPGVLIDNAIPREERENLDLFSNMLFYVQCYGKDVIDILEAEKFGKKLADDDILLAGNIEEAVKIKNDMGYPLLVRSMGFEDDYAYVTNNDHFIAVCNTKLQESPSGCIGITDNEKVYLNEHCATLLRE